MLANPGLFKRSRLQWLLNTATLKLPLTNSDTLDSRITATRASTKTYFDSTGTLQTAAINEFPREYDPSTLKCLGRSFWEARTNLLTYSHEFDNAAWVSENSGAITANQGTAPDGSLTADSLSKTLAFGTYRQGVTTATGTYTASCFFKSGTRTSCSFAVTENGSGTILSRGIVNLSTGAVTQVTGTISAVSVGNGWFRVYSTVTTTNTSVRVYLYPGYYSDATSGTVLVWGAQLELGATLTPYIPTTSASVTRSADVVSMTGTNFSSWYNQTEGTFLVVSPQTSSSTAVVQQYLDVSDASVNERMFLRRSSAGIPALAGEDGGVTQFDISDLTVVSGSASFAACFGYKVNDVAMSVNGRSVSTDTAATIPTLTQLHIGQNFGSSQFANAFISRITYWPARLSNTDLQILSRST